MTSFFDKPENLKWLLKMAVFRAKIKERTKIAAGPADFCTFFYLYPR